MAGTHIIITSKLSFILIKTGEGFLTKFVSKYYIVRTYHPTAVARVRGGAVRPM